MSERGQLIIIAGPTASGKSALALSLARQLRAPIISADSMQVYRGMDIGTAKPTPQERAEVSHRMLDIVEPSQNYSVAQYQAQARNCIEEIHAYGQTPILTGGTGLYIHSVIYPVEFSESERDDGRQRAHWLQLATEQGAQRLYEVLQQRNPQRAAQLHPNDVRRVVRALEASVDETGDRNLLFNSTARYDCAYIGLQVGRVELIHRIDARVDSMMAQGLLDEVRALLHVCDARSTAMQAIGYKELAEHLRGEIPLHEAVERIKIATRQYAKRQMTWFRREKSIHWLDAGDPQAGDALPRQVLSYLHETQHIL